MILVTEEVFFEWKNRTTELITENTTIISQDTRITPLEFFINAVIEELNK